MHAIRRTLVVAERRRAFYISHAIIRCLLSVRVVFECVCALHAPSINAKVTPKPIITIYGPGLRAPKTVVLKLCRATVSTEQFQAQRRTTGNALTKSRTDYPEHNVDNYIWF